VGGVAGVSVADAPIGCIIYGISIAAFIAAIALGFLVLRRLRRANSPDTFGTPGERRGLDFEKPGVKRHLYCFASVWVVAMIAVTITTYIEIKGADRPWFENLSSCPSPWPTPGVLERRSPNQ